MAFRIASAPLLHQRQTTSGMMRWVILACVPGIAVQSYFFGCGTIIQIMLAMVTALVVEPMTLSLRRQPVAATPKDNSGLLTAVLLGIILPPLAPWWWAVLATAVAVSVKQLSGGLGHNRLNPAMAGYVLLVLAFPTSILHGFSLGEPQDVISTLQTLFSRQRALPPFELFGVPSLAFNTGVATLPAGEPLATLLDNSTFNGFSASLRWVWINLAFLVGGLLLLARGIVRWQIPVSFLLALSLCALAGRQLQPEACAPLSLHLFSGFTLLAAFFIVTDPVTSPTTGKGRLLFGALTGALVWVIRTYGGYPEGVAFAVLLGNLAVPVIDRLTQPRISSH
ncbi:RnfABCDGE type electron transport complex subunit D [Lonsdalea quercina]|uniref:RnfABCDGE type electron transport complex subunit D n=1 Tax=Lonsdalea quercina TaxID=71657 RepID=UPI00047B477C|nr:RnfABCDGE type electron transport complex subunit D [Lonsdalea quercina]